MLSAFLGTSLAGTAFAVGLVCAGQASTLTGTLASQIVMEGYLRFKIRPFLRRLLTRMLAIVPAAVAMASMGEAATCKLLILSQVILGLQLFFAVLPLIHFTDERDSMGKMVNSRWMKVIAWTVAAVLVFFNGLLDFEQIQEWTASSTEPLWIYSTAVPAAFALGPFLLYVFLKPLVHLPPKETIPVWRRLSHFIRTDEDRLDIPVPHYLRVGVAVAFANDD